MFTFVQIQITETHNFNPQNFWVLFEKQNLEDTFIQRFKNNYLFVVDDNDKRILPFEKLSENDNFETKHLFSSFIPDWSYFFDGLNKYIFKELSLTPFEGVKEYAETIEEAA